MPDFLPRLFAVLIAYATNLGLHGIAQKSSFTYAELAQVSDWYLTEEALRAAIADVVAYQHQLELASNWGDGTFSMSDAQKLEGGATDPLRAAVAREFGYRRGGVSLLTWVSDMYAIYGQKIVTLAGRESTYTLDEIAHNPILEIQRHTTDTYGSTVMWTVGCVKGRRHQLSTGSIGSPSSSRRCARRAAVQRWRSTSRGQPRCAASSARRSSVSRRVRSLGAYSGVVTNLAQVR